MQNMCRASLDKTRAADALFPMCGWNYCWWRSSSFAHTSHHIITHRICARYGASTSDITCSVMHFTYLLNDRVDARRYLISHLSYSLYGIGMVWTWSSRTSTRRDIATILIDMSGDVFGAENQPRRMQITHNWVIIIWMACCIAC